MESLKKVLSCTYKSELTLFEICPKIQDYRYAGAHWHSPSLVTSAREVLTGAGVDSLTAADCALLCNKVSSGAWPGLGQIKE